MIVTDAACSCGEVLTGQAAGRPAHRTGQPAAAGDGAVGVPDMGTGTALGAASAGYWRRSAGIGR